MTPFTLLRTGTVAIALTLASAAYAQTPGPTDAKKMDSLSGEKSGPAALSKSADTPNTGKGATTTGRAPGPTDAKKIDSLSGDKDGPAALTPQNAK
jgi:hypothetical protein